MYDSREDDGAEKELHKRQTAFFTVVILKVSTVLFAGVHAIVPDQVVSFMHILYSSLPVIRKGESAGLQAVGILISLRAECARPKSPVFTKLNKGPGTRDTSRLSFGARAGLAGLAAETSRLRQGGTWSQPAGLL